MARLLKKLFLFVAIVLCFQQTMFSQDQGSLYNKILATPDNLIEKINGKSEPINSRITRQTERYLMRMAREERKLKNKLVKIDSTAAKQLFGNAEQKYFQLEAEFRNTSATTSRINDKYIARLDTLLTMLKFLEKGNGLSTDNYGGAGKLKKAISSMDVLQTKFNRADEVKYYLKNRKQFLQEQLGKFGMTKELQKYKKQVYYYQAQVEEYKKMFDDPSKLEAAAMHILRHTPLFREFFNKHSQLAGMFNLPGNPTSNSTASFTGLQTRDAVQQLFAQRFGSGINVQQMIQQQVQGRQSQLKQLKDKINQLGGSSDDMEMPDFNPNNQKVKPLKNRLEFGTNLQTVKSNRFFPSTSDIGLSLGYKLNDKSTVGVGGSYKMGWGKDIRHINISHEGVGIRSFLDYKIKGSFWLSGGGELNYRSQFANFEILNNYSAWQKSALLGLSKKYKVSNKLKGNAQLMYDFLWKEQILRTQPLIFRVGYSLK